MLPPYVLAGAALFSILLASFLTLVGTEPKVFVLLVGAATAAVLITHPRWLWLILIAGVPFSVEFPDLVGAGNNLVIPTEVLAPLAAPAIAWLVLRSGKVNWTVSPIHGTLGVYLLVLVASLATSEFPFVTLKALIRTFTAILGGYVLVQIAVQNIRDLRTPFAITFVTTLILVAYGFYTQFVEGISIYQDIAHPFFGNHCIYAAYICFPAAFVLGALTQPIRGKAVLAAFLAVVSVAILFSFVRGAWFGMLILVLYLAARHRSAFNFRFVVIVILLGVVGVLAVVALNLQELLQERWQSAFDIGFVANESRIDRWMAAISMWAASPILGSGFGCYPDLYYHYIYDIGSLEVKLHMGAHNLYLEILAELGVVGLFAYSLVIFAFFIETRRLYRLGKDDPNIRALSFGLESMMVVYLIHAFVNNLGPSDEIDVAFWTTLGLAAALRCSVQRSLDKI